MAGNSTQTEAPTGPKSGTIVVAIIVPSVLILVLLALLFVGFLLPRLIRNELATKESRWKLRQEELESHIKSQDFYEWMEGQKEKKPGFYQATDPLCAICLEDFSDDAQIRGLRCSHAYHSRCLDEWFTRYNEYCPLCHRPIIPGSRAARTKAREEPEARLPVMLMV